jgi:hypothetical protein
LTVFLVEILKTGRSNAGKKRSKPKEKDDARELWCPSPTPSEDWGSDADVDFRFEIVGEEVGYNERIMYVLCSNPRPSI